jgi:uncharacterized membrane protein YtjA (UPF0391 family)
MLHWALAFVDGALITGLLGFGGAPPFAGAGVAKILFCLFLFFLSASLITHFARRDSNHDRR